MKRLLMLTLAVDRRVVGGLQLALEDLRRQLELRGWEVESRLYQDERAGTSVIAPAGPLARLLRWPTVLRWRQRIPVGLRVTVSAILQSRQAAEAAARNLDWAGERLREVERYDAVLVCVDGNVRGMLALALARHPRVTVLSLGALEEELRPTLWWLVRLRGIHPYYHVPAKAKEIRCAVFASERWREGAVAAGLPAAVAHTVYFGVPVGPFPRRDWRRPGRRLLWVGRLVPEKGLHLLLAAMPRLRELCPDVTLTAVAAQGEASYRALVESLMAGLGDVVTLRPAVARERLPELYAEHDALFFHSENREPVALVLMEAYANGLPVAANRAETDLVRDGVTCLTYDAGSIAEVVARVLNDGELRAGMAERARRTVEERYSLEAMGAAFERLL